MNINAGLKGNGKGLGTCHQSVAYNRLTQDQKRFTDLRV